MCRRARVAEPTTPNSNPCLEIRLLQIFEFIHQSDVSAVGRGYAEGHRVDGCKGKVEVREPSRVDLGGRDTVACSLSCVPALVVANGAALGRTNRTTPRWGCNSAGTIPDLASFAAVVWSGL